MPQTANEKLKIDFLCEKYCETGCSHLTQVREINLTAKQTIP